MNYATCKISNDGFYLLPDEIFLVPVLNSEVDFYANIYESSNGNQQPLNLSMLKQRLALPILEENFLRNTRTRKLKLLIASPQL